jgi:hypothetical protein
MLATASTFCKPTKLGVGGAVYKGCGCTTFFFKKEHSMGWIVYSKKNLELLRYYDIKSKAQAQVTGHNKKAVWNALINSDRNSEEWACCEWLEYEAVFKEYYQHQKSYMLQRSSWR